MADITIKRGDTIPALPFVLTGADGAPQVLTGATVLFKVRDRRGRKVIDGACAITNPLTGAGEYVWAAEDLDLTPGDFEAEFEVTLLGGNVATFPNDGFLTMEIVEDIE